MYGPLITFLSEVNHNNVGVITSQFKIICGGTFRNVTLNNLSYSFPLYFWYYYNYLLIFIEFV